MNHYFHQLVSIINTRRGSFYRLKSINLLPITIAKGERIQTRYGLEGQGIESQLKSDFRLPSPKGWEGGTSVSVLQLVWGLTVRESNPSGGKIFRTYLDGLNGPPSLLYDGYQISFRG
jgi:hypothetical protein